MNIVTTPDKLPYVNVELIFGPHLATQQVFPVLSGGLTEWSFS
jgi:hypothetical protein